MRSSQSNPRRPCAYRTLLDGNALTIWSSGIAVLVMLVSAPAWL